MPRNEMLFMQSKHIRISITAIRTELETQLDYYDFIFVHSSLTATVKNAVTYIKRYRGFVITQMISSFLLEFKWNFISNWKQLIAIQTGYHSTNFLFVSQIRIQNRMIWNVLFQLLLGQHTHIHSYRFFSFFIGLSWKPGRKGRKG